MRAWEFLVLTGGLAAGCSDGASGDDSSPNDTDGADTDVVGGCFDDPMTVTPGTGDVAYIPLAANDPVVIHHGPQGGWHIETAGFVEHAAQALSIQPKVTIVSQGLGIAGTELPVPPDESGDLPEFKALANYSDQECLGEFWGVRAFIDDVVTPPGGMSYQEFICTLEGEQLELEINIADLANDRTAVASVVVTGQLDPADVPLCHP
jgi:hypothetical protein